MSPHISVADHPRLTLNSRALDRGSIGWSIDGRSREGRFLLAYQAMLAEHLGGSPSRVQRELIRRCARLALHLELQDEKLMTGAPPSDHTARQYLAWNNALVRTLARLGLQGAAERAPTLAEIIGATAVRTPSTPSTAFPAVAAPSGTSPACSPVLEPGMAADTKAEA
jgi:hypothetical protein